MWVTLPDAEPRIARNLPDQNAAFKLWGGGGGHTLVRPFCSKKTRLFRRYFIVEYPDITNYLVLQMSWATKEQMKAYKSLEAYNSFVSGRVKSVRAKSAGQNKVVLFSRVSFSYIFYVRLI